jgi:hypothetical protein
MPKKLSTSDFISNSISVHGDKYDYSKSEYTHSRVPIIIICKEHGEYIKTPHEHITLKRGCTKCFFDRKRNKLSNFIDKSRKIHGDKYDYTKVEYVNNLSRIRIVCPKHGEFIQRAGHHMSGRGCPPCSDDNQSYTTEQFINKSMEAHGNLYDYSKSIYRNWKSGVKILCKKHGQFNQLAGEHIGGAGCPRCSTKRISNDEINFLDELNIDKENRQHKIPNTRFIVDGFDPSTKEIYEYLGDYWHGNPIIYSSDVKIMNGNVTCGDAYNNTFNRFKRLSSIGYKVKYIWEADWKNWIRSKEGKIPIKEY